METTNSPNKEDGQDIASAQNLEKLYEKKEKEEEPKTLEDKLSAMSLEQAFNILVGVTKQVEMNYNDHRALAHSINMVHMALNQKK
tara:strand:+ start:488 stop:745 length:258 start_codon:yes stop_codon:yes gene_type:complete